MSRYINRTRRAPHSVSPTIPWGWVSFVGRPGLGYGQDTPIHTGGKNSSFPVQLEKINSRPLGPSDSNGVSHRDVDHPSADTSTCDSSPKRPGTPSTGGDNQTLPERRCYPCRQGRQSEHRFLLDNIPGPQEGHQTNETGSESETPQSFSAKSALQNGGIACGPRSPAEGGLVVQNRPEGRIFCDPSLQGTPAFPAFHLEVRDLSVHMPPVWACVRTSSIYQGPTTSCRFSPPEGSEVCDILGRPAYNGKQQGAGSPTVCCSHTATRIPRVSCELFQVTDTPDTRIDVPRPQHRFSKRGIDSPSTEAGRDTETGQEVDKSADCVSKRLGTVRRKAVSNSTSNPSSSSPLPRSPTFETSSPTRLPQLQHSNPLVATGQRGPGVVAPRGLGMEREESAAHSSRVGVRDRCLPSRMGSLLPRNAHRWQMVRGGGTPSYQRAGAASGPVLSESIPEACQGYQRVTEERQCNNSCLHKSSRRHEIENSGEYFEEYMALVPSERNNTQGSASTWQGESEGRFHVSPFEGQNRLGPQPSLVQPHQSDMGPTFSGPFCNEIFSSVAKIFQLASRSGSGGHRCLLAGLEELAGLCTPTVVSNYSGLGKSSLPESDVSLSDPLLANTAMVSPTDGDAGRLPSCSPTPFPRSGNHTLTQLHLPSADTPTTVGRMEGIRRQLRAGAISEDAINLILASWREKTNSSYNSAWRKWERWCSAHNTDPFSASIAEILDFLMDEFKAGREYRSLNCYRSAISSTHLPIQGFAVGKHPLVCRLLKGAYNLRPPQPKYSALWDVEKVLSFLRQLGANTQLSMKELTMKLAMLLALVLAHRSSDLVRLSVVGISELPEAISIPLTGLAKQSRPGHAGQSSVIIASFRADPYLCPVACLQEYTSRTGALRVHNSPQLLIAMVKPHKPVLSCTIARWIKSVLKGSGIDISKFSAHSTRGSSTSKAAAAGISTPEIMERAGWSQQNTFERFYHRPSQDVNRASSFGCAVLQS